MKKETIKTILKEIAVEHVPNHSGDAFDAGLSIGKKEKDQIGYTQSEMFDKISPEAAMGVGYDAGRLGLGDCDHEENASFYVEDPEVLSDWVGIRRHSMAPCERSYRKAGDMLVMNPELVHKVIKPILDATGATCPVSAAKAAADILELLDQSKV